MSPIVQLEGVGFHFGSRAPVLHGVDLVFEPGEFVAIAGPNGGGKTTLLKLILGLERPTQGRALLFGEPAHHSTRRFKVGYLPQRANVALSSPITVRELVASGRAAVERSWGPLSRRGRQVAAAAVERMGLQSVIDRPVQKLSGGQQQRAFLAKLLAGEPELIALDEPTVGVDADAQEQLGAELAELHKELGVTILFVSHEFGAVEDHVERLILVRGGITYDGAVAGLPKLWHDPSHHHPRGGVHVHGPGDGSC